MTDTESSEPAVDEELADHHMVGILVDVAKQLSVVRDGIEGADAILTYPEGVPWEYHTAAVMACYLIANAAGVTPDQVAEMVAGMREQERTGTWCPVCVSPDHALEDCPKAPQHDEKGSHDERAE